MCMFMFPEQNAGENCKIKVTKPTYRNVLRAGNKSRINTRTSGREVTMNKHRTCHLR